MRKKTILILLLLICSVGYFHNTKPLPEQVSYAGPIYNVDSSDVRFLQDRTYIDNSGVRQIEQQIFDEVFQMIDNAQDYILIDLFFYSDFTGVETTSHRQLARELTNALLQKKRNSPNITIQVITDPINIMYGGHISNDFESLRAAGIPVTITDVRPLRDSNPIYSSVWRTGLQWFDNNTKSGWLPNPLDESSPKLTIRTYLKILNYKANHRKVILADYKKEDGASGFSTIITSANPHDGSSAHSNIAIRVDSQIWQDIIATESAVVNFSGGDFIYPNQSLLETITETATGTLQTQILTEGKIEARALDIINNTQSPDTIDIAMFYIADRDIVRALQDASQRGTKIRLLLDPNKDAFGREKNGTPNRQVANELMKKSSDNTDIRWCDTHGEQCHSKLLLVTKNDQTTLMQGSANYTKRNLQDYNLETNIAISGDTNEQIFVDAQAFFDSQWNNEEGRIYSAAYETYADTSQYKTIVYKLKEFTGLSRW